MEDRLLVEMTKKQKEKLFRMAKKNDRSMAYIVRMIIDQAKE